MEYTDNRSGRIIYLGSCLLNENARAQGFAVRKGPFAEFVQVLLSNQIGIEQLPCPECLVWGGVSRPSLYRWQPLLFASIEKWWWPIIEVLARLSTFRLHKKACRRLAIKAVDRMEDYTKQGHKIIGVVTADEGPTCGVTRTVDLLEVAKNHKAHGISLEEMKAWTHLEVARTFVHKARMDGTGAFAAAIMKELRKRRMDIDVVGYDMWAEPKQEAERLADLLGLSY